MITKRKTSRCWLPFLATAFLLTAALPVSAGMTLGPEGEVIESNQESEATRLLGPEYKDEVVSPEAIAGFRIHTPAGARLIQRAGLELLSFVQDKYQWAGTVQVTTFPQKEVKIDEYLKSTAEETAKNFKAVQILESRTLVISDKPAGKLVISMEGIAKDRKTPLYMQQVAVQIATNQYMVLSFFSPLAMKADAEKTFNAMVQTFQVMDRKQIESRRITAVKNGRDWYALRSPEELAGKLRKEPQLFRIKVDNRDVGYIQINEKETEYLGYRGVLIITNSRTFPEDGSIIMSSSQAFWAFEKQPNTPSQVIKLSLWSQSLKNTVFLVGGGGGNRPGVRRQVPFNMNLPHPDAGQANLMIAKLKTAAISSPSPAPPDATTKSSTNTNASNLSWATPCCLPSSGRSVRVNPPPCPKPWNSFGHAWSI